MRPGGTITGVATLLCALVSAGSAPAQSGNLHKQAAQLVAMTPAQFEASADLQDDSLETVATITTKNGWQLHEGLLGVVKDDSFFRAFIDKKTGAARFQVYHVMNYVARRRASFETVNYETPAGPVSAPLTRLARTREGCRSYSGCPYEEIVGFDVDPPLLRTLAAKYVPGQVVVWKYRLKARSGAERDAFFVAAEIAGILAAVDQYRTAHALPGG